MPHHPTLRAFAAAILGLAALTACTPKAPAPAAATSGKSAALLSMERVATAAHRCWFASKDPTFKDVTFANELNSFTGRPRFLLVPKRDFGGKPLLVVQAEGAPARVDAFGPMLDGTAGGRIRADVGRWSAGSAACA